MPSYIIPSEYCNSNPKRAFDLITSAAALALLSPSFIVISALIKLTSKGPVFFIQKRIGKKGKTFNFTKFRTMKLGAHKLQKKYKNINEADGPVFKIRNDPRFTKIGRYLADKGLDELPQLINVIKGEMSLVGPRPLPVSEVNKILKKFKKRHLTKPGIFSPWTAKGPHTVSFKKWMESDLKYLNSASFTKDITIIIETIKKLYL